MSSPIEVKVPAAAVSGAVAALIVWGLQTYVFKGDVPLPVAGAVQIVIPAIVSFVGGYLAPHTPRPDLGEIPTNVAAAQEEAGEHALDGDPGEIPASQFAEPKATRYDGPRHPQL